jgi:hypothetical protein
LAVDAFVAVDGLGADAFVAGFFVAAALAVDVFAVDAFAVGSAVVVVALAASAASARADFETAARALPAAVWAPFALFALPSAIRVLAAFCACAFEVVFTTPAEVWTAAPPVAALNFRVRRD